MSSTIYPVYRFWFTTVDPFLAVTAIFYPLFDPTSFLLSLTSRAIPAGPDTTILLGTIAGAYAFLLLIHLFVLRPRPDDIALWKSVQAGQALFEGAKLAGVCWGIRAAGSITTQVGSNIGITASIILLRVVFLLGLGNGKAKLI